jgi:hypothetical protein
VPGPVAEACGCWLEGFEGDDELGKAAGVDGRWEWTGGGGPVADGGPTGG